MDIYQSFAEKSFITSATIVDYVTLRIKYYTRPYNNSLIRLKSILMYEN